MINTDIRHALVTVFALAAAAVALSPASQLLAGETSVTLDDGDAVTVEGGGTKVETDANGNVKVYVNGNGSVEVYTDEGVMVRPKVDGATAARPQAGDRLVDGTIYADNNLAAAPADAAGGLYTWSHGKRYCEDLEANGHDDWTLPTEEQLSRLYQNRNAGTLSGTFNENDSSPYGRYWSFTPYRDNPDYARLQYFGDGGRDWIFRDATARIRCVRSLAP